MSSKSTKSAPKISYEELALTWYAIFDSLEHVENADLRANMTSKAFTELLPQVGWTLPEWHSAVDRELQKKKKRS